jgi:hypothetical protein
LILAVLNIEYSPDRKKNYEEDKNKVPMNKPYNILHGFKLKYSAKSIATCKKNPYIINQNHIFSKNYCEVISG